VRKELITLALIRLASSDPEGAIAQLSGKWALQLTTEERNWVWGVIGKQAAGRLSDAAPGYYANVTRDTDLSDDHLAWKVRAALRQGQWKAVLSATQAMSEEGRADPAWVYWRARALLASVPAAERQLAPEAGASATGGGSAPARHRAEVQEARQLLESIASVHGFYEKLALEELGQRTTVPSRPAPLTPAEKDAARQNAGLGRALYAIRIGLRPEGVREWNYSTNLHTKGGMSDRELLAAADLACQNEVWDRCINTSERTKSFIDLEQRFPMPYRDAVVKRSREIGIDPAYVYGLIRQESRFIMDARSGVGASGLMQVMPATARWTAKKIGLVNFTPEQITDRDTNIAIGTGYLKLVLGDFGGSMPLAAAAYNAGPGRPRAWRNGPTMEAAIWAENVPFAETRDYVKKVLANTTSYAALLSGQPQSLKARLGLIGPRDSAAGVENKELP
jgi:soluble lytic murein transglycosylase